MTGAMLHQHRKRQPEPSEQTASSMPHTGPLPSKEAAAKAAAAPSKLAPSSQQQPPPTKRKKPLSVDDAVVELDSDPSSAVATGAERGALGAHCFTYPFTNVSNVRSGEDIYFDMLDEVTYLSVSKVMFTESIVNVLSTHEWLKQSLDQCTDFELVGTGKTSHINVALARMKKAEGDTFCVEAALKMLIEKSKLLTRLKDKAVVVWDVV